MPTDYSALRDLIAIDSPAGYTAAACRFIYTYLADLGYAPELTNKGAVRCTLGSDHPTCALAAHTDTLGAVVSQIRDDGQLSISPLGGLSFNMVEGEYVRIRTLEETVHTGTFLVNDPSVHANRETAAAKRTAANMFVRIDAEVTCPEDTRKLGIRNGDVVCFYPRYEELPSGFIKSRFLDNKAGCFVLLELARRLRKHEREVDCELFFSNYEEVGHGGTVGYSASIAELLVLDMGVVGKSCEGKETACSICAKDSSGPYDYDLRRRLVRLAEENGIAHVVDVYPFYASDGTAALRAGKDFRVGLIGPGVAASHGVERTHQRGIEATIALCEAYLGG